MSFPFGQYFSKENIDKSVCQIYKFSVTFYLFVLLCFCFVVVLNWLGWIEFFVAMVIFLNCSQNPVSWHKDWCMLIRTKRSTVSLLRLVRINVHQSLLCRGFETCFTNWYRLFIFRSCQVECRFIEEDNFIYLAKLTCIYQSFYHNAQDEIHPEKLFLFRCALHLCFHDLFLQCSYYRVADLFFKKI